MQYVKYTMKYPISIFEKKFYTASIIQEVVDSGLTEDSFFICNISDIVNKYEEFVTQMPRIKPFYAVCSNDHWSVLNTLAALGSGFVIGSKNELNKILSLGIDKSRIFYSQPVKAPSHIKFAEEKDVDIMIFDSETELYKIKSVFPRARLVIRIQSIVADHECILTLKFGCNPETEAPILLSLAKKIGLNVVGVSFHVNSGDKDMSIFQKDMAKARQVLDCAIEKGFKFNVLNIGGEFPDSKFSAIFNESIEKYFPESHIDIIAEPGRCFVSSAFTLACSIQSLKLKRDTTDIGNKESLMYYINDGMYHSFSFSTNEPQTRKCVPLKFREDVEYFDTCIWGQSLDNNDVIVEKQNIPKMKIGDWIYFKNMGAYNLTITTTFNGFTPAKTFAFIDENTWEKIMKGLPENLIKLVKLENIVNTDELLV